jgi:alpha-maltose-1-phosphate synthase
MILTVGGDAASKGAQEVMQALAIIDQKHPTGNMFARYGRSPAQGLKILSTCKWL